MRMPDPLAGNRVAIRAGVLSVTVGFVVLVTKFVAWSITGSTVLFADAAESIVNVIAAAMATYSVAVAARPADQEHPYGHGKAELISAAVEGTLIVVAATIIVIEAIQSLVAGPSLQHLGPGIAVAAAAGLMNLGLGLYLRRTGRQQNSEALRADGAHVLTDVITTAGGIAALVAVHFTGIQLLDPLVALLVAASILFTGGRVVRRALGGLLDEADFDLLATIARQLERSRRPEWVEIHQLRARHGGARHEIDLHLTVPRYYSMEQAHRIGDALEESLLEIDGVSPGVVVHLDPCQPRQCSICTMERCPERSEPTRQRAVFDVPSVTKSGAI